MCFLAPTVFRPEVLVEEAVSVGLPVHGVEMFVALLRSPRLHLHQDLPEGLQRGAPPAAWVAIWGVYFSCCRSPSKKC